MGSRLWFKNIITKKKAKGDGPQILLANGASVENHGRLVFAIEDTAATQIQTSYRAYLARKAFCHMRGMVRLQNLIQCDSVKSQASTTLIQLQSWGRIQSQIMSRRIDMATEGRIRLKKLENQLKLEEKLHDLEVEWSGGSETMGVALARIHKREAAAVKRERAMAYAFSHQATMNLVKKIEAGAGWIAGLLLALGRARKSYNKQKNRIAKNDTFRTSKAPAEVK